MQTIKIIGSGPLRDVTTYGSELHIALHLFKKGVAINFAHPVFVGERETNVCEFNIETGCAMVGDVEETDLLMVDLQDLPLLQNMYWRWMGEQG